MRISRATDVDANLSGKTRTGEAIRVSMRSRPSIRFERLQCYNSAALQEIPAGAADTILNAKTRR